MDTNGYLFLVFLLWDSCFQASLMELLPDLRKFSTEWALFSQNIYKKNDRYRALQSHPR